jgi:hypothetical protein
MKLNKVYYEWCYETVDEHGDIIDNHFEDKLKKFFSSPVGHTDNGERLVLVRNEGNEIEGVTASAWAYVVDGKLPEYFSDSLGEPTQKVPVRFKKELENYMKS